MMTTVIRTIDVVLTADDTRYILHALEEFKKHCHAKIEADEDGDGEYTHMYANDIMQAKMIHDKLFKLAKPVFGEDSPKVSNELL